MMAVQEMQFEHTVNNVAEKNIQTVFSAAILWETKNLSGMVVILNTCVKQH